MSTTTSDRHSQKEIQPATDTQSTGGGFPLWLILSLGVALPVIAYILSSAWPKP